MSPSRPFILRPVATTLLMVGVLLVGWVAFRQLPISALPQVDYRPFRCKRSIRRKPRSHGIFGHGPVERQFGQTPGLNQMTSTIPSGAR